MWIKARSIRNGRCQVNMEAASLFCYKKKVKGRSIRSEKFLTLDRMFFFLEDYDT